MCGYSHSRCYRTETEKAKENNKSTFLHKARVNFIAINFMESNRYLSVHLCGRVMIGSRVLRHRTTNSANGHWQASVSNSVDCITSR